MKTNIYAVYDIVAKQRVGQLMTANRDEPIIRIFTDAMADKQLTLGQHPADYQLMRLATLNEETLDIEWEQPDVVLSGKTWLAMQDKNTGA